MQLSFPREAEGSRKKVHPSVPDFTNTLSSCKFYCQVALPYITCKQGLNCNSCWILAKLGNKDVRSVTIWFLREKAGEGGEGEGGDTLYSHVTVSPRGKKRLPNSK